MTAKKIVIESIVDPDILGYEDKIVIATNGSILYHGICSACPNPRKPLIKGGTPWTDAYGWIACGTYKFTTVKNIKFGKWLILENGGIVQSRNPNPNHSGRHILTQVGLHKGWSDTWRGSAGCITIPPKTYNNFFQHFAIGETGELSIVNFYAAKRNCKSGICQRAEWCPIFEKVDAWEK